MGGYFIETQKKVAGLKSPDIFPYAVSQQLDAVCAKLEIAGLSQFEGQSRDEVLELVDLPEDELKNLKTGGKPKWFSPASGLRFVRKLQKFKRTNREDLWDDVLRDLGWLEKTLVACEKAKVRWRLAVDC